MSTNGGKVGFTRGSWDTIGGFVECKNKTICSVYPTKIHDEHIAIARLIAAAPDLLEALKEILPYAAKFINGNHPTMQNSLAAIARADGGCAVTKIIDHASFERGRETAERVIREQGFDRAKMNIEMTIASYKRIGEYTDFDRGCESVIAVRETK